MRNRAWVSTALALVLGLGWMSPALGLSLQDARCRRGMGKGVRILADKVIKETTLCHRLRMKGQLPAVDCNDLVQIPGAVRISRAEQKLGLLTSSQCAAATPPQQLGYVVCPAPCETVAISDYASVAACLTCVAEAQALEAVVTAYNTPTLPASNDETVCQGKIGTGLRKYFTTKVKEQQKCQYTEDQTPSMTNCRVADPTLKVSRALTRARLLIADCNPVALVTLNTCSDDVTGEQMCVQAVADADTDDLFTAVYDALDGVFVSSTVGSAGGDGSILNPLNTISAGMTLASSSGIANVFIDSGTYAESLTLPSSVNLLGGFDSSNGWRRNNPNPVSVFGSTTAVTGSSVSDVVIDKLDIHAASNTAAGGSSYGVRLSSPTNVLIKNSQITAGNGGNGTGGSNGSGGAGGTTGGTGGNGCENSTVFCSSCGRPSGGGGGSSSCGITGGTGGRPGRCDNETAEAGGTGGGVGGGSGGGSGGQCESNNGGTGNSGNPGANGNDGTGAGGYGSGTSSYTPANGGNGTNGASGGAGGGGGGGSGGGSAFGTCDSYGGAGGGGGGGGCAGTFATGGTGAGGSFGVWITGGSITLDNVDVTTGSGGTGGNAGTGGSGGSGGTGGAAGGPGPNSARAGGSGGSGGSGGRGGHGGGGGGGPTVGLVCTSGGLVAQNSVDVTLGTAGAGGSSAGNPGSDGLAAASNGCP